MSPAPVLPLVGPPSTPAPTEPDRTPSTATSTTVRERQQSQEVEMPRSDELPGTGEGYLFPYDLRNAIGTRDFLQWLVEQLGDRMVEQLEQRGGRHRGEF